MKKILYSALTALALLAPVTACPMCKEAIPQSDDSRVDYDPERQALGYNYSIYLMLAVPFTLAGVMGLMIYRACRNAPSDQMLPDQMS